jgi:hypothetical protein
LSFAIEILLALRLPTRFARSEHRSPRGAKLGSEWLMIAFPLGKNCRVDPAGLRFVPGHDAGEFS